jgi:hypothetical protein
MLVDFSLLVRVTYPLQNAGCYRVSSHCLLERSRAYLWADSGIDSLDIHGRSPWQAPAAVFFIAAVCIIPIRN